MFTAALLANAASVLVPPTHPSCDATPGADDATSTQSLVDAGTLIGIAIQDHVIVGSGTEAAYSFGTPGATPEPRPAKQGRAAREPMGRTSL